MIEVAKIVKGDQYEPLPEEALDLVDRILQLTPSSRPDAAAILQHPFFQGVNTMTFHFPALLGEGCHILEVQKKISKIINPHVVLLLVFKL